jgi:hypothetical protein
MAMFLMGITALVICGFMAVSEITHATTDNKDLCNLPEGNQWTNGITGSSSGILNMISLGFFG